MKKPNLTATKSGFNSKQQFSMHQYLPSRKELDHEFQSILEEYKLDSGEELADFEEEYRISLPKQKILWDEGYEDLYCA